MKALVLGFDGHIRHAKGRPAAAHRAEGKPLTRTPAPTNPLTCAAARLCASEHTCARPSLPPPPPVRTRLRRKRGAAAAAPAAAPKLSPAPARTRALAPSPARLAPPSPDPILPSPSCAEGARARPRAATPRSAPPRHRANATRVRPLRPRARSGRFRLWLAQLVADECVAARRYVRACLHVRRRISFCGTPNTSAQSESAFDRSTQPGHAFGNGSCSLPVGYEGARAGRAGAHGALAARRRQARPSPAIPR